MQRAVSYLVALSLALSIPVFEALPAYAASSPSPRPPSPRADIFKATTARQGVPQSGPGTTATTATGRELSAMRSRNSTTVATNGGYVTNIYASSIHFKDKSGKWQPIDNTLVPAARPGFAVRNKSNGYTALLPGSLSSPVRIELPTGAIEFVLSGATGTITSKGSIATYANAFSGADVSYSAQSDSVKETITLSNVQAPTTFVYALHLPTGWLARSNPQAGIDVLDATGIAQAALLAPFMYDGSNQPTGRSNAVAMTLAGSIGSQVITMSADKDWINSAARVFPVVVDPTIWTNTNYFGGKDCVIQNSTPDTQYCSSNQWPSTTDFVGYDGSSSVDRSLYYFPINDGYTHIVPNSNILDAELDLTLASSSSATALPVTVYPIQQAWNDNAVTWNRATTTALWSTPGGTVGPAISTLNVGPTLMTYAFIGLTQTVQSWATSGTTANLGLLLRTANESQTGMLQFDNQNFNRANPTDPKNPHLRVQWNGWGGLQPFFTYSGTQVNDRMSVAVNVANGQLVVHSRDLSVRGVGLNLAVDRFYNSLSSISWHLGNGWNLSAGCDVRIDVDDHDGVSFWSPDGYQVLFRNNGSGGYITPPGINTDLVKNGDGTFTMTFRRSGIKYNFQAQGCLQNVVDRNGNTLSLNYNGTLQSIIDTENRATILSYNSTFSTSFITKITDSANRVYQYGYDTSGNLTSYTDANNQITRYAYNSNNQMSQITDPIGNVLNFAYSATYPQPLIQVSRVDASCSSGACNTNFAYNSGAGWCTSSGIWMNTVITDANGHNTTYCYDNLGRVLEVRDPLGNVRKVAYDANHDPTQSTDALGQSTQMSYDTNFNLTRMQFPSSQAGQTPAAVVFTYQAPGQTYLASSVTDSLGNCGAFFYDPSGNITATYNGQIGPCDARTGGLNTCDAYQGDAAGTCGATSTVSCVGAKPGELCWAQDGNGHRTTYTYDSNGNLASKTPPAPLGAIQITVDSLSRTTAITDGKGQKTTLQYDALDRVVQILYGGAISCSSPATCTTFQWDADGNLISRVDATGTTNYSYDHLNRLTMKSLADSTTYCSLQSGITTTYDDVGNLIQYCDSGGAVTFSYDAADRLASLAEPGGSCGGTISLCTTYQYDSGGRLLVLQFPGGAQQRRSYDNVGNLTAIWGTDSSSNIITRFSYAYSQGTQDFNVRLSMTENDPLANLTTTYSYDSFGRLSQASNPQTTWSYGYDAAGNRTSGPGGASTFNNANEITSSPGVSSYSFDANGNLMGASSGGSFTYNSQNQTTAATWSGNSLIGIAYAGLGQVERSAAGSTTFASGALGLAISKNSGSSTYFLNDAAGRLIGERTPDGNHWYYLKDGLGSIVAVISGSGATVANRYSYDPYGQVTLSTESVANPWGFGGGYQDSTGLVQFGDRYYDPKLGRYTQPSSDSALPDYLYAGDNPINFADPSGHYLVMDVEGGNDGKSGGGGGGGGGSSIPPPFFHPFWPVRPATTPSENPGRPQTSPQIVASDLALAKGKGDQEPPKPGLQKRWLAIGLGLALAGYYAYCFEGGFAVYPGSDYRPPSASGERRRGRVSTGRCFYEEHDAP